MDRALKEKLVDELGQIFESSGVVVVSRYEGMTVAEMQDLRAQMREVGGSIRVAKIGSPKSPLMESLAQALPTF